jgi:hypothetical protein
MCLISLCFFVFSFSASSLACVDLSGCSFLCIFVYFCVYVLFVSGMFDLVCVCVCACMCPYFSTASAPWWLSANTNGEWEFVLDNRSPLLLIVHPDLLVAGSCCWWCHDVVIFLSFHLFVCLCIILYHLGVVV